MSRSLRWIEPPVDPPARRMVQCAECEGDGTFRVIERGLVTEEGECSRCEGYGSCEFDPNDDPYAPDTWKEAEGIA